MNGTGVAPVPMTTQHHAQNSQSITSLRDYLAVFYKRRKLIILAWMFLFGLSLAVAFLWPPTYKSTAMIMIEEQELPLDLVHATITSFADQRIETIKQQVMSRTTLLKVAEQYDLYPKMRRSPEDVVKRLTNDIEVAVISADVVDKRTQHATKATIAFTVSYSSRSAETAQRVANELTTLFLGENVKSRERQAQGATAFLQREAESLAKHIEEVEGKLAKFKRRASNALPELMALNLQLVNQTDRELMDVDQQIRSLEERKAYLEGELATIKPNTPIISVTGERILDSAERLRAVRSEYASASANLSPDHPDVIKMKMEIEGLEKETGSSDSDKDEIVKQLIDARATLTTLTERLGHDHPDVVRVSRTIGSLEQELRRIQPSSGKRKTQRPENPAYINIQAQLNSATSSLNALRATRKDIKARLQDYATRIERTPEVEPEYLILARDRDTSTEKYQDIRSRLLEAKVSEGLEIQRKGERFVLIDPPILPEKPEKPNRPALVVLGFLMALAGGVGAGTVAENFDRSIRAPRQLASLTHALPLALIPYMPNNADLKRALTRRKMIRWSTVSAGMFLLILIHLFWTPLDILWYAALKKFGLG